MSYKEDPDWKQMKSRRTSRIKHDEDSNTTKKVLPIPRFCEKWLRVFEPWLARSNEDPNKPFCRACQISLDSNRCHLQRHERTSKHARNLQILIEHGEEAARENYNDRLERSKYYYNRKLSLSNSRAVYAEERNEDEKVEEESAFDYVKSYDTSNDEDEEQLPKFKTEHSPTKGRQGKGNSTIITPIHNSATATAAKKDRLKLFLQIQKDKNDLMNTFQELMQSSQNMQIQSPKEKNHVDLFFESVSSTVKTLSPKLIAEAKMRVQQLICELELRELTEGSVSTAGNIVAPGTIVVSSSSGNLVVHRTEEDALQQEEIPSHEFEQIA